jgi:hypothetical protein
VLFFWDGRANVEAGLTEAQVRLQFTKEEAAEVACGLPALHDVSASSFVTAGLDLEEEQYVAPLAPLLFIDLICGLGDACAYRPN